MSSSYRRKCSCGKYNCRKCVYQCDPYLLSCCETPCPIICQPQCPPPCYPRCPPPCPQPCAPLCPPPYPRPCGSSCNPPFDQPNNKYEPYLFYENIINTTPFTITTVYVNTSDWLFKVDTTTTAISITLPRLDNCRNKLAIGFYDIYGNSNVNNITINVPANSNTTIINNSAPATFTTINTSYGKLTLIYDDATRIWFLQ